MALKCPECSAENEVGEYYCKSCGSPLIPEDMIPSAARRGTSGPAPAAAAPGPQGSEQRYRIILGDSCTICRAVSRITFTADRPPRLPVAGCRDPGGCRCSLPVFAGEVEAAVKALAAQPELKIVEPPREPASPAPVAPRPAATPAEPDWKSPAAITLQRQRNLQELTQLFLQRRIQGIRIATAPGCCQVCSEVAESIYDPAIAPPIPIVGCEHGWQCRCQYAEEPMPLDERGLDSMRRLERIERERALRRRGIALGGPRALHIFSAAIALLAIMAAIWGALVGDLRGWAVVLPVVPAALTLGVAAMAIRRLRPLPAPARTYLICGLLILILGLGPLWGLRIPEDLSLNHLDRIGSLTAAPSFSRETIAGLARALQALAISGFVLLLAGAIDSFLAHDERPLTVSRR
jgi:hypothetical protein